MKEIWATSVQNLMNIFRDSLLSLVPVMDRANIAWKKPDAYDDWDEISETLFRNIVKNSILNALPENEMDKFHFPEYGFYYESYENLSYIEVESESNKSDSHKQMAFSCFSTLATPFDVVACQLVNSAGNTLKEELITVPFSEAKFSVRSYIKQGAFTKISELDVRL